jgi:hypothetical protein
MSAPTPEERLDIARRAYVATCSDVLDWLELLRDSEHASSLDAITAALVDTVKLGAVVETALLPALEALRDRALDETAGLDALLTRRELE